MDLTNTHLFSGLRIIVAAFLAGTKRAIIQGDAAYVSPAMYDLISHADPEELELLLSRIECVRIPEVPSVFDLPMTTVRPEPENYNYAAAMLDRRPFLHHGRS